MRTNHVHIQKTRELSRLLLHRRFGFVAKTV